MPKLSKWPNHASGLLTAIALLLPYFNATASLPTTRSNPRMSNVECSMLNVGRGTSYTYTPDGKLATRTWARGITTTYAYTNGSSLASITYSDDTPTVHFSYDRLGRQISAIVDGVSTNLYSYDALTLALSAETQNGVELNRFTDTLGRPAGLSLGPDYAIEYAYDEYGRFKSVESAQSADSFSYSYLPNTDLLSGYTAGDFTRTVSYEPYRSLITSVANKHGSTVISQYDYTNDQLGRRTAIARSGIAFGDMPVRDAYGYNHRSEVTSARRSLVANPSQEIRGFSYDYAYDPIGNRISSTEYDPDNSPLTSSYTANALNQYQERTIPGYAAVRGSATNSATVTVNGNPTWRLDDYFYGGDEADNSTAAIMKELAIIAAHSNHYAAATGHVFVAKTPEQFQYDDDGNLTQDGRWQYTWNGENRLIKAIELIAPTTRQPYEVNYAYDHRGRMVWKTIAPSTAPPIKTIAYTWDDYNIIAEHVTSNTITKTTYNVWGLDLSGTLQDAGGVGGLLAVVQGRDGSPSRPFLPCYDTNGNITEYLSTNGTITAHYEYSPFGEIIIQSGDLASTFTHRFSTKPWCIITSLSEYELRKYSPGLGRWMSRDPIGEAGGMNFLGFLMNNCINNLDLLGLTCCSQEDIDEQAISMSRAAAIRTLNDIGDYKGGIWHKVEYCGRICCDKSKKVYSTPPERGETLWDPVAGRSGAWRSTCDLSDKKKCQKGDKEVAIYHSHPDGEMSDADKENECIYMQIAGEQICWRWRKTSKELCWWNSQKGEWQCKAQK